MSAALASPGRPSALTRWWRRAWLTYRVRCAMRDYQALMDQMDRDLAQVEAYSKQIAIWRAEIAYHQEPQEGS